MHATRTRALIEASYAALTSDAGPSAGRADERRDLPEILR